MPSCIRQLIDGYGPNSDLATLQEPQIIRRYDPDSLAYVWAALSAFLRLQAPEVPGPALERPKRHTRPQADHPFIASDSYQIGSSSPMQLSSSPGSESSIGYTQPVSTPPVEDATLRLASCFIRCVLNYGQPEEKATRFPQFRDARQSYPYKTEQTDFRIEATDDGGLHFLDDGELVEVAMVEAKRTFQIFGDKGPIVSDNLLAQLVGEALALERDTKFETVSNDK